MISQSKPNCELSILSTGLICVMEPSGISLHDWLLCLVQSGSFCRSHQKLSQQLAKFTKSFKTDTVKVAAEITEQRVCVRLNLLNRADIISECIRHSSCIDQFRQRSKLWSCFIQWQPVSQCHPLPSVVVWQPGTGMYMHSHCILPSPKIWFDPADVVHWNVLCMTLWAQILLQIQLLVTSSQHVPSKGGQITP